MLNLELIFLDCHVNDKGMENSWAGDEHRQTLLTMDSDEHY